MDQCEFCQIVRGEKDAHVLHDTEQVIAFLDSNPAVQGHTLVVPKPHSPFLFADDESIATTVFRATRTVAMAINRTLEPDGASLFYTSADLVGHVTHAHVHLLPRYRDDDISLSLARAPLSEDDATRLAARIREQL